VIAAGYADGVLRAASATDSGAGREVIAGGRRCRIVGRISMDLLALDITDLPEGGVRRGDMVTLIGGELTLDAVAAQAGTIGYEILTGLGHRYRRVYKA
jgi:alanine racemase